MINESARLIMFRFYDPAMHGVDWDKMKSQYEPPRAHVAEPEDLHDLTNMMIGELNASHTGHSGGGRGGRGGEGAGEQTRFPGFDLEPNGGYWKVTHVYRHGPADKDYVKSKSGDYVIAVDGKEVKATDNIYKNLSAAPGSRLEFTVNSKPAKDGAWTTKVTPVSSTQ